MIVEQIGYMNLENVLKLEHFSIYETHKKTHILIENVSEPRLYLCYPKYDRLPWKLLEGKKICYGKKVFDTKTDTKTDIDISKWNGSTQIMVYEEYQMP